MIVVRVTGGLGNQMFQYAFARKLQAQGRNVVLQWHGHRTKSRHNGLELDRAFDIPLSKNIKMANQSLLLSSAAWFMRKNNRKREPKNVGYSPQCLDATSGYLDGYWQSEKYFEAIADTIRSDFRFKLLKGKENLALQERIASEPCVSVHVRRGDYLTIPSLAGICSVEYYTQALARVDACAPGGTRVIFSDDIPYCRELFGSRDAVYVDWNRKENSWMDMALMGLCKHHIIANSSFSWWGAWLGESRDGITIAPRHWYAAESNTRNPYICPERWERIE